MAHVASRTPTCAALYGRESLESNALQGENNHAAQLARKKRKQHVTFKTQELSNTAWAYAVLYSDGLLGTVPDEHNVIWKPTAMLDAGMVLHEKTESLSIS